MAQRVCPECGHVENEYTFFCTECGAKTVESSGQSPVQMKSLVQPETPKKEQANEGVAFEPHKSDVLDYHGSFETEKQPIGSRDSELQIDTSLAQSEEQYQSVASELSTSDSQLKQNNQEERKPTKLNPVMLGMGAAIIILVIVVVALLGKNNGSNRDVASVTSSEEITIPNDSKENVEDNTHETETFTSVNNDKEIDQQEGGPVDSLEEEDTYIEETASINDSIDEEFGVSGLTVEDYSRNLNHNYYKYYNSGITDFDFWYPADLFNSVYKDTSSFEDTYGRNIETITFDGSGGSRYIFSLTKRTDNMSVEDMMNYVHQKESNSLYDSGDILVGTKDDYGKVIVTGWLTSSGDYPVYDLTKIEEDYVLRMCIIMPNYTGEEDRLQKAYLVENVYRMCDYSDSKKAPRSYEEFLEEN